MPAWESPEKEATGGDTVGLPTSAEVEPLPTMLPTGRRQIEPGEVLGVQTHPGVERAGKKVVLVGTVSVIWTPPTPSELALEAVRVKVRGEPGTAVPEAVKVVAQIASAAKRVLGLRTINPVVCEFICGACNSLDEYSAYLSASQYMSESLGSSQLSVQVAQG